MMDPVALPLLLIIKHADLEKRFASSTISDCLCTMSGPDQAQAIIGIAKSM